MTGDNSYRVLAKAKTLVSDSELKDIRLIGYHQTNVLEWLSSETQDEFKVATLCAGPSSTEVEVKFSSLRDAVAFRLRFDEAVIADRNH